jgi:hypothetical protein
MTDRSHMTGRLLRMRKRDTSHTVAAGDKPKSLASSAVQAHAAPRHQTHSGQRGQPHFRRELIALAQLLLVDVLQNEGDGSFVKRLHRADSTLITRSNAMSSPWTAQSTVDRLGYCNDLQMGLHSNEEAAAEVVS